MSEERERAVAFGDLIKEVAYADGGVRGAELRGWTVVLVNLPCVGSADDLVVTVVDVCSARQALTERRRRTTHAASQLYASVLASPADRESHRPYRSTRPSRLEADNRTSLVEQYRTRWPGRWYARVWAGWRIVEVRRSGACE